MDIKEFEKKIGYFFKDDTLLKMALTHSSYGYEVFKDKSYNNERLEFLGDAVLELTVSDFLINKYIDLPEGKLTKIRASIVCEPTHAICARDIHVNEVIMLGKGEDLSGGRFRDSIVSDALEAVIGAIYTDGGIECAKDFIHRFILNDIDNKKLFVDSKTILQEMLQATYGVAPEYVLVNESGPDHNKVFETEVRIEGRTIGHGSGRTKKAAEQQSAYNAILDIKNKQV